ncbi:hypothetical protein BGZ65_001930 [Modicella reniformis]|uniref:Septin-type G domain-containing protein n=1 Tax=Modicella reniformis TaxID=1440133 RepID=A0A9P6M9W7_9FUNG|nr:hypothetical protein BGZ65_001930 [Modicella reniformis]
MGVGKSAFIDTFISTLCNIQFNETLEEFIPQPMTSFSSSTLLSAPPIRLPSVQVQTAPILQQDPRKQGLSDPLGILPPKTQTPAREVSFVTMPGYSSTTNPSVIMSMTDDYLNHHLHVTTSIFSPSIPPSQLAWFLIAGSGAHSLPTCAFYFVLYELKPVDILYMKLIHERVNLVPIITKADTLSQKELWMLKRRMIRQLKLNSINFHTFGVDLATVEKMTEQRQWGAAPFTVSSRRDANGNLFESELQSLIRMCLYERFRHSQEDAVRKVIAWRTSFGPSDIPSKTPAQIWGNRSADQQSITTTTTSTTDKDTIEPKKPSQTEMETQLMTQFILQNEAEFTPSPPSPPSPPTPPTPSTPSTPQTQVTDQIVSSASPSPSTGYTSGFVVVPTVVYTGSASPYAISGTDTSGVMSSTLPNSPANYVPTTSYSPRPKAATTNTVPQARLNLMHQSTGVAVDGSTRPSEIMDDKDVNNVDTEAQVWCMGPPSETADINPRSSDLDAGSRAPGSEFKVEVPNSGTSYQPTSTDGLDLATQLQYQQYQALLRQQKHESFIIPNGYQFPGAYFIPPTDQYQSSMMAAATGGISPEATGEILPDIWEAVELGDLAAVQRHLINGASPDQRNSSRSTLLHRTAWQGSKPYAVMRLLISYGANVNLTNENGNTVLQNVLMRHDDPSLIKLLLDNGAETTIPNKEGMNTLEVAALFNKLEPAKYLLENDLASSESNSIMNALQRARSPDKKAMKLLLKSWQGKEGEKKRTELMERQRAPGLHTKHSSQSQVHLHERGLSQHQNTSNSQTPDATSIHSAHSFETGKSGEGK